MIAAQVRNLTKRYGALTALDSINLTFHSGEIHAVVGENGAGKSTLVGCLSGFIVPSSGELFLKDQQVDPGQFALMRKDGVRVVHQHFKLVPSFSVRENLQLSLRNSGDVLRAEKLASEIGFRLDFDSIVRDLPVGVQQRIEVLKAISSTQDGAIRLLLLDEPTAVLSEQDIAELFAILRQLAAQGCAIVLIAHKLSEVMEIADRVSVLRKGRLVATSEIASTDARQISEWMVGQVPALLSPNQSVSDVTLLKAEHLEVRGDRGELAVRGISLTLMGGEILGIGGVDGNGQVELAESLAGVRPISSGKLEISGMAPSYIPQDRQRDGLVLEFSIRENLAIGSIETTGSGPFLQLAKRRESAMKLIEQFDVRCNSVEQPVASLSGGNQQKVVLARVFSRHPQLIIAVNPTRGLDVAASTFVRQTLINHAKEGAGVVVFSTDHDELAEVATRRLFMVSGRLTKSFLGDAA